MYIENYKVLDSGLLEQMQWTLRSVQDAQLNKKDKKSRMGNIPKLESANRAGKEPEKCTLILTEGDSAKTLAVAGLGVVGRDYYGVFPLRGKLLNAREASVQQMTNNEEIKNLKMIMGLDYRQTYTDVKKLNYGHIMIMTDQVY